MPVYRHSQVKAGEVETSICREKRIGIITNAACERRLDRRVFSSLAK